MANSVWPLFELRVTTPQLELHYLSDDLIVELSLLAAKGIHDPEWMPFGIPWTDVPSPQLERNAAKFHWRCRGETAPEKWSINLAVIVDGTVVGLTALEATEFPKLRQFGTGSWLGREFQGIGIGKEMRNASLHLGFLGLGAELATTGAWHDNAPSLGVTHALGYKATGVRRLLRRDQPTDMHDFAMTRADFIARLKREDIELHGIEACLPLLGIDAAQ